MRLGRASRLSLSLLLTLCGCHQAHRVSAPPPTEADAPISHAVQSGELRRIMDRLDALQLTVWPQELQAEYASAEEYAAAKALWEARRLADALAEAAVTIPSAVAQVPMPEVDRRSFEAQVETLRDQAVRLEQAAGLGDRERMRRVLESIDETCLSCHQRFRDISGSLPPR